MPEGETVNSGVRRRVRLERKGSVGLIIIDNPPVNAGSWDVRSGIFECIRQIGEDPTLEAAVLVGTGTTFIAGSDIKEFDKPLRDPQVPAVIAALENCPKPVVAAIHGAALGGGFEIALGCDARVAENTAVVGLPEVQLGLIPGAGGTQRMLRLTGMVAAIELITTGRKVPAPEALRIGLIDTIAEGDLREFAAKYALEMHGGKRRVRDMAVPQYDEAELTAAVGAAERRGRWNPAIAEAIAIVRRAADVPIDIGLKEEREIFQRLRVSESAAAMRYLFFAERKAGRLDDGKDAQPKAVRSVGVVGGGTMGAGIAVCFADAGIPVTLVERHQAALDGAFARLRAIYMRSVESGELAEAELNRHMSSIRPGISLPGLSDVDLVIEAVPEEIDIKREILTKLDDVIRPETILASNTSYLDLNRLGMEIRRPERFVGMHFFAPANLMPLMEVVRTAKTSTETLATAVVVARKLRKVPVIARVCEGFIGNRIYSAYRRECEILLEEGAYPEQIDSALEAFGFAMGPFAVSDLSGLDIAWQTRKRQAALRNAQERYVDILDQLCELGRLGRKTKAGWYDYSSAASRGRLDPAVHRLIENASRKKGIERRQFTAAELQGRALAAMLNEAALVLEDGVAERASDIDLVLVNGCGFPAVRGGILFWVSRQDRKKIEQQIDKVAADIGFGFRRANLDRAFQMLREG
ncbi:3-hydroxyacyl-CoA dehydrogenase NAD-binding domain-containing protein [Pseudorhodoplanes sp.]|uniref:3-hydroxyacyl-CoA dehydrogenase NAD-binding domain-containing protein n=1 Tax=Pseudorhodoplanes sp. TaxID=1934341 RepID=UPI003D115814